MNQKKDTIHQDARKDLANLYESRYFQSLTALVEEELNNTKTYMLNKSLSADDLRFYQGRAEGLGVVLLRVKNIYEEEIKNQEQ